MDTKLKIGYGGWLQYCNPEEEKSQAMARFKALFFDYRVNNMNHSVRSAYYLFKALERLQERGHPRHKDVEIKLWGKIEERNQGLADKMGVDSLVEISGMLDKDTNLKRLDEMDMVFFPLEIGVPPTRSLFIPGKLYECMLLRKPILAIGGDSDAKQMILDSGLGFHFEYDDYDGIADFLERAASDKSILKVTPNEDLIKSKSFDVLAQDLASVFSGLHQ